MKMCGRNLFFMVAQAKVFSLTKLPGPTHQSALYMRIYTLTVLRSSGTAAQSTKDETWRLLEGWVNGTCQKLSIITDAAKLRGSENWPRSVKRVANFPPVYNNRRHRRGIRRGFCTSVLFISQVFLSFF